MRAFNAFILFCMNCLSIYMIYLSSSMLKYSLDYTFIIVMFSIIETFALPFTIAFYVKWFMEWLYIKTGIDLSEIRYKRKQKRKK